MIIAATNDTDVNIASTTTPRSGRCSSTSSTSRSLCNFILPAIIRTGPLAIAIRTAGASPGARQADEARDRRSCSASSYADLAEILNDVRGWAKGTLPTYNDRKAFFEEIVNGDPDPIGLLRDGRRDELDALIAAAQARHGEHVGAAASRSPCRRNPGTPLHLANFAP